MGKRVEGSGLELNADVLVVGGGPAAAWAALAARESGADVVMVDKGYVGSSGALAASTSGERVLPPLAVLRDPVKFERYALGGFLAQHRWWDRLLDETYVHSPKIWAWGGYDTPDYSAGQGKSPIGLLLQGSEVMRILRKRLLSVGVKILDQSPALELLVDEDGAVAGARGIRRQEDSAWTVRSGATVLASGGVAWLSKALGCNTNTGDGLLQAVEAGAELSGMEFSSHYSPAPIHSSVTKGALYLYASHTDKDGKPIEGLSKNGHRSTSAIAKELLKNPVYCRLDVGTEKPETRRMLRLMQPNFFAPFDKIGLDPFEERWRVTLVLEGTVRGTGGVRVANDDCASTVEGLYVAGDAASREFICGGFTGGGGPNMTWAVGSGNIAGRAAAGHAKSLGPAAALRAVRGVGGAGLVAQREGAPAYDNAAVVKAVQAEMLPYEKNIFRTEAGLVESLAKLARLWEGVQGTPARSTPQETQRSREAAALVATARWAYFSGLERKETRGMHKRLDHPGLDPQQRHYLAVGGLEKLWTRAVPVAEAIVPEPAKDEARAHAA